MLEKASLFWVESSSWALAEARSNYTREGWVPLKSLAEGVEEKGGKVVLREEIATVFQSSVGASVVSASMKGGSVAGLSLRREEKIPIPCRCLAKKEGVEGVTIPLNRLVRESIVSSSS